MTREECESIFPGMKCLIADDFVEDPHPDLRKYLGTIQEVDRLDESTSGWLYFKGISQPFAFSEIVSIIYESTVIDDESVQYQIGNITDLYGGVDIV